MFPMFAAVYHWWPKMLGRVLDERLGKWSFWLIFIGFNMNMFPLHISGILGQPRRTYTYQEGLGWEPYNLVSTVGAFVLGIGILLTFINWFRARKNGAVAGDDPFEGETLEWSTSSPPPHYNFVTVPTVRSKEPMWDQPELHGGQAPEDGGYALDEGHVTMSTSLLDAEPQAIVHMPHESPWPFRLALALLVVFYGVLIDFWPLAVTGVAGCIVGIAGWFWPREQTQET